MYLSPLGNVYVELLFLAKINNNISSTLRVVKTFRKANSTELLFGAGDDGEFGTSVI